MKKAITILIFLPLFGFGQWTSQGFVSGQAASDRLGSANSIAFDSAGETMAVGSAVNSQLGTFFGYAKVFTRNGTQWIQKGQTIHGSAIFEGTGGAVDLTADGNTLVVSSPYGFNSINWKVGLVRVFDWNGTQWVQRGNTLEGEGNTAPLLRDDNFGYDVSITPDGNFLAIGAPGNTKQAGVLTVQGHARVFQWNGKAWVQMGQDIDGVIGLEEFGRFLDISADGTMLVVGSRGYRTISNNNYIGSVQTFKWNGTDWVQFGQRIVGLAPTDRFGSSVSISNDGSTIAVGNRAVNGNESAILLFKKDSSSWSLKGLPIIGILNDFGGGTSSLSSDGNVLGVGFSSANSLSGFAKVFQWNGSSWMQVGSNLLPTAGSTFPGFGTEICLSQDGSRVLIGSSGDDGAGNNAGRVYMFQNTVLGTSSLELSQQFDVFPNPVSKDVRIKSNAVIDSYALFSIEGKLMKTEEGIMLNELTIDMTDLSSGVYFLNTSSNGFSRNSKIIKK